MKKFLIGALVTILVFGVVAVVGEWYARGRIVDGIESEIEAFTGTRPEVQLDSSPLLLGLARGSISGIDGVAETLTVEGITFESVDVQTTDISTSGSPVIGTLNATAQRASVEGIEITDVVVQASGVETDPVVIREISRVEAVIPSATIEALVREQAGSDVSVTLGSDVVGLGMEFLGQELAVNLVPELADGVLSLIPRDVTFGGLAVEISQLPFGLGEQIQPIPVELPLGSLILDSVTLLPDGAHVTLSGTDVSAEDFTR